MTTPKTTVSVALDRDLPFVTVSAHHRTEEHERLDVDLGVLYVSEERWIELGNEPPEPALVRLSEAMTDVFNKKTDGFSGENEELWLPEEYSGAITVFIEMIDNNVGGELLDVLGTLSNYEDLIEQARLMMLLMKADLEEGGFHKRLIIQANEVVDFLDIAGKHDPDKEGSPF